MKQITREAYLAKLLSFIDIKLKPLKVLINSGNGAAGPVIDALRKVLAANGVFTDFVWLITNRISFPNGIPNPLMKKTDWLLSML